MISTVSCATWPYPIKETALPTNSKILIFKARSLYYQHQEGAIYGTSQIIRPLRPRFNITLSPCSSITMEKIDIPGIEVITLPEKVHLRPTIWPSDEDYWSVWKYAERVGEEASADMTFVLFSRDRRYLRGTGKRINSRYEEAEEASIREHCILMQLDKNVRGIGNLNCSQFDDLASWLNSNISVSEPDDGSKK